MLEVAAADWWYKGFWGDIVFGEGWGSASHMPCQPMRMPCPGGFDLIREA